MTVFTGIIVYLLIWWVMLFAVLPWGIRHSRPEPGNAPSAPENPRILRKFAITSAASALVWLIVFAIIEAEVISFREIAEQWHR